MSFPLGIISTYRQSVVEPASEFEHADLVVEREEGDVDGARGAELGGRRPEDVAVALDQREAAHVLRGEVVGAAIVEQLDEELYTTVAVK